MANILPLPVESFRLRVGPPHSHLDYRINPGVGDEPPTPVSFPSHILHGPGHAPHPPPTRFQTETVSYDGADLDFIDVAKQEGLGNFIPLPQVCLLAFDL